MLVHSTPNYNVDSKLRQLKVTTQAFLPNVFTINLVWIINVKAEMRIYFSYVTHFHLDVITTHFNSSIMHIFHPMLLVSNGFARTINVVVHSSTHLKLVSNVILLLIIGLWKLYMSIYILRVDCKWRILSMCSIWQTWRLFGFSQFSIIKVSTFIHGEFSQKNFKKHNPSS